MPIPRCILLIAALVLALTAPVSAAWSPLGGPIRPVIVLQLDPGRPELLYARAVATGGGGFLESYLWRSEDAGGTWRDVQAGLERPISALAIDPENPEVIWAWTRDGQLWRSGDAGDTWSQHFVTTAGLPPQVRQLLVDPHHPDTLFRVGSNGSMTSVAVSRDGGASFTSGAPVASGDEVFVHPGRDELVAFDLNGLEVSANGGQTWSLRGQYRGTGFRGGRLAPSAPDTLYGLTSRLSACLARSDDAGAHWQSLAYPHIPSGRSGCYAVAIDPRDARHVWVAATASARTGNRDLLSESHDGGATWASPFPLPASGVVAAGGEVIYTGSVASRGLYASQDGGRSWRSIDQGIAAGDLRGGFVAQRLARAGGGRRLFALDTPIGDSPDAVYRSDGGRDWVALPLQQPVAIVDAGDSTVVAIDQRGVVRSRNGGDSWQVVPSAPKQPIALRSNVTQPRYVALLASEAGGADGNAAFWTSDDGGATWRRSSNGLPIACAHIASVDTCPDFPAYAVDPFDPSRRWVASTGTSPGEDTVFVSEDAGASWQVATTALPQALALAADPAVEGRLLIGTYGGLFVSEDAGRSWFPLGDLPAGAVVHQFVRDAAAGTWYAATIANGIYRSLDGGAHWTLLAGAPDHDDPAIAVDPRRPTALLAAFRGQGIWRWTP